MRKRRQPKTDLQRGVGRPFAGSGPTYTPRTRSLAVAPGEQRTCGTITGAVRQIHAAQECGETLECDCDVLGGTTFELNVGSGVGLGLAPGAAGTMVIDAGDACRFQAKRALIVAYRAGNTTDRIANPLERLPVLMTNVQVGTIPQERRVGSTRVGIISDGYSDNKDLTCVNWASFISTNNQGLVLTFNNPNDVAIHIFVILWGNPLPFMTEEAA